ncbi:glutaredoxin [Aspergillus sclerotioniger CBS 115572]|uniref:Glutaredoxin n=1 Tax=Aspergillus sclerotioniger CBS 115572 TaxID=1450535 RepID=A0A317WDL0_9EURO|nr:glutaredoxin [Aspergillus sclerotioniger CBS 115572]PWY83312.1 glutaredoxin [Aspergillus sclerotioniger CBS 115572]
MLSQRRIRLLTIAVLVMVLMAFYYSSEARSVQNQQFYRSTVAAMEARKQAKEAGTPANIPAPKEQTIQNPIKEEMKPVGNNDREEPAIPKANGAEEMEEIPIAGRTKMTIPKNRNDLEKENSEQAHAQEPERDDHAAAVAELNGILKRAPIIVFSKSYCPHSARAKSILLDKYSIVPAPFVVELDQHELGRPLQTLLGENTGRHTVPNVLVNGNSIGGGDDVTALDQRDELASTLKSLGGKWVQEVRRKE